MLGWVVRPSAMQVPSAQLILSCNGACVTVHPGHLIGRLAKADVVIPDPRISEAHALISLRCHALRMLALRGPLTLDGLDVDAVTLERGQRVELADGLFVTVESVEVPTHALVLLGAAQGPVELDATTHSLLLADGQGSRTLRLVAGHVPGAAGHLWYSGASLWICPVGRDPEPIQPGGRWTIEGCCLRVIQRPLGSIDDTITGDVSAPVEPASLLIFARYATVHVRRGATTYVITGKPANLVSELVTFDRKPVPWQFVARKIWGEQVDRDLLRDNFDSTLGRLRRQLRDLGLRDDLVIPDGSGNVELVLHPGDRVVDET